MPDWRVSLHGSRRSLGLSREELGRLAGVSAATVRAYETGRRRPSRRHLEALIWTLNVPYDEGNAMLEDAGFAPRKTRFTPQEHPHYYYALDELPGAVEEAPWPEFVLNDAVELVAANSAIQAVWDVDVDAERAWRSQVQMNLLSVASDGRFADRVGNWDEVVAALATVLKARPHDIDHPNPYLDAVLAEFARGDPVYLARLTDVWVKTPAHDSRCYWRYPVVWRDPEHGEMRFLATVSVCSEPDGTAFNAWHPLDGATWDALARVKERWTSARAPARARKANVHARI